MMKEMKLGNRTSFNTFFDFMRADKQDSMASNTTSGEFEEMSYNVRTESFMMYLN
jgi:hypothetical protein